MTTETTALAAHPDDTRRRVALLKAVGWDRLVPEQRELALSIADRYGLDPMLRHIAIIDGRPVVTRDGLLHVAHRSGVFDGIQVTPPSLSDGFWRCTATVWRRDMSRPFEYPGRFPDAGRKGRPTEYAEEMAIKVAESMALRRAFDVAAPVQEERWDVDMPADEHAERPTLAQRVEAKRAEIVVEETETEQPSETVEGELVEAETAADFTAALDDAEAEARFKEAVKRAKVSRDEVGAAARKVWGGIPSTAYSAKHWIGLAAELGIEL